MAAVLLGSLATPAFAQPPAAPSWMTWFTRNKVLVRKTFETTKDTDSPAAIFWSEDSGRGVPSATLADVSIKAGQWEPFPDADQVLAFSPVVEWHRGIAGNKKVSNKLSATLRAEWNPLDVSEAPGSPGLVLAPAFVLSETYKRDLVADSGEDKSELLVSLFGLRPGLPGYLWLHPPTGPDAIQALKFTYQVDLGGELIHPPNEAGGGEISTAFSKLTLNYWPIGGTLQWKSEGIYRKVLQDPADRDRLWDVSSSLNWFPYANPSLALGVDYSRGHDANDKFTFREKFVVAVKLKLGE